MPVLFVWKVLVEQLDSNLISRLEDYFRAGIGGSSMKPKNLELMALGSMIVRSDDRHKD